MLHLVRRVTISIKLRHVACLDPVPSSIRARNAQGINITNYYVTTWSWVNLVNPVSQLAAELESLKAELTATKEQLARERLPCENCSLASSNDAETEQQPEGSDIKRGSAKQR